MAEECGRSGIIGSHIGHQPHSVTIILENRSYGDNGHAVGSDTHHSVFCLFSTGKGSAGGGRIGHRRACGVGHDLSSGRKSHHQGQLCGAVHGAVICHRSHGGSHSHAVANEIENVFRCRSIGGDKCQQSGKNQKFAFNHVTGYWNLKLCIFGFTGWISGIP